MTGLPGRLEAGRAEPLGASFDGGGVNFSLFSGHAENVDLCLFDETGQREIARLPLPERTSDLWHGYLKGAEPGLLYGYRVHGPYDPKRGHRFNSNKLLIDPYAKSLVGGVVFHLANFGYRYGDRGKDLSFDDRDNAAYMPKCRVVDSRAERPPSTRPRRSWADTILYELHVRGYTKRHPDIDPALRGTFAGLASAPVIDHLLDLGVTAVELMPIHAFSDERHLARRGLGNYWGYNSYNFFCPEPRYLAAGNQAEVREAVNALHAAGIEVIVDVVYNHTAEGDELGPTLSFRGIDNAAYYQLAESPRRYVNHSGCGNTLNIAHPRVRQMIVDSLAYWADWFDVDGFRFDLAVTLGRNCDQFDPFAPLFAAIREHPSLAGLKLIAEPWDVGPDGHRTGNFPAGWSEWNDRYRNCVRRTWRGDAGMLGEFAQALIHKARLLYAEDDFGLALAETVYALDATTIDLCLSVFPWARFQRTKGAIKLHTLLDLRGPVPSFIHITDGKLHDVNVLDLLIPEPGAFYVMDRGYLDFARLYVFQQSAAFFVIRARANTRFRRLYSHRVDRATGLVCDQTIVLDGAYSGTTYPERLRRIRYRDPETGKSMVLLTNNLILPPLTIAELYRCRWQVELFFKWIKQHLRIKAFYGTSENAVRTQIWIAVSVYVLVAILKKRLGLNLSLYTILQILSLTAFERIPLNQVLSDAEYGPTNPNSDNQLNLFD